MKQHLHMSIGPVQAFVAQSRRTRDLWGSSYLLSFLAAHAMNGARRKCGTIIRPRVDDDAMLRWVDELGEGEPPTLGSLPNQFTVQIEEADPVIVASAAEQCLREAWQQVCRAVWERYIARAAPAGNGTEAIWKRQTEGFWELVWVVGTPDERGLLARRKLWRTHTLPEEAGSKCTVMPDLQEISGFVRSTERIQQDGFWSAVRDQTGELDLQDNERLCAIAFVKRFYARNEHLSRAALGWAIDVARWPSTVDVAAATWSLGVRGTAQKEADAFADAALAAHDHAHTGGVSSLIGQSQLGTNKFLRLDSNWLHRSFVASPRLAPLSDESIRQSLLTHLDVLTATAGTPPIYFALLLADGDQVGSMVALLGSDAVSLALSAFTQAVPNVVSARCGVTVYAGGDDVLALLPVESALDCAREIEHLYRKSFGSGPATLSAAVVFAHARDPLNQILAEAHGLLDLVAKAQNKRSSLAAGVYRGGASAVQWVTTWERLLANGARKQAVDCLKDIVSALVPETGGLSGSLLQDLRHVLGVLCGSNRMAPGTFAKLGEGVELASLVRAEIEHRLDHRDYAYQSNEAERLTSLVCDVLGRSRNGESPASYYVGIDGILLASFLAGGGREEEHHV